MSSPESTAENTPPATSSSAVEIATPRRQAKVTPDPVAAAESDLLGEALAALRSLVHGVHNYDPRGDLFDKAETACNLLSQTKDH